MTARLLIFAIFAGLLAACPGTPRMPEGPPPEYEPPPRPSWLAAEAGAPEEPRPEPAEPPAEAPAEPAPEAADGGRESDAGA